MTCRDCRWWRLRADARLREREGVSVERIRAACADCAARFAEECVSHPRTCRECEWKDRGLPHEQRAAHCRACAEAWAKGGHRCDDCAWNDQRAVMPTDAAMAHCKACLAEMGGGKTTMNCASCPWRDSPKSVRVKRCAACSIGFSANRKVSGSTNELSNKGQTIESYDNHNAEMADDRDIVSEIRADYIEARRSKSADGTPHPVFNVADRCGMTVDEFARDAYDFMKRFVYEMAELTDVQALLFLSTVRGERQCDFAKSHGLSSTAVNAIFKQVVGRSEVFRRFVLLTRGTLEGTRGRKAKKRPGAEATMLKAKGRAESGKSANFAAEQLGFQI